MEPRGHTYSEPTVQTRIIERQILALLCRLQQSEWRTAQRPPLSPFCPLSQPVRYKHVKLHKAGFQLRAPFQVDSCAFRRIHVRIKSYL